MTVTSLKIRRNYGSEAGSEVSTDRNSAGICNLDFKDAEELFNAYYSKLSWIALDTKTF
jgi:hypothetical protein